MTNPDNIVRVRARNGGRASVYEANGWCQAYSSGLLEGTGVVQNTIADMNVLVGGSSSKPDVVLAQNPANYKIALDLVGQQAVTITAPATNSRISAIVAYTDDLALESTEDTITGSPATCGLIVVNGTTAANPTEPTDNQIRTAITSDGATGSQASYCVIATIKVASSTTTITDSLITIKKAMIGSSNIDLATLGSDYTTSEVNTGYTWTNGKTIYKKTVDCGQLTNNSQKKVNHNISNIDTIIKIEGIAIGLESNVRTSFPLPYASENPYSIDMNANVTQISIRPFSNRTGLTESYVTLYYTKTS